LKGFEKVMLRRGESRRVELILERSAFEYYDLDRHEFVMEPGDFDIMVGRSSAELPLRTRVTLR
ncbi:MAG: fibronectin type III-like domain-contianing protein, partial [Muribaculaceae bacterium]|nr:fibronectin type III-like domain-contianing protein [Muribaculaceae bacterium]